MASSLLRNEVDFDLAIVGLGYVGLPVAVAAQKAGLRVIGIDINDAVVAELAAGHSHVRDVGDHELSAAISGGLTFTADVGEVARCAAVSIAVPTPLRDGVPDLSYVESATTAIGASIGPNTLVVLESTTYPGTTTEVIVPILEEQSGFTVGQNLMVGYSPERIDPGNDTWGITNTPKLVAGVDSESASAAQEIYRRFCDTVVPVSGTGEAEMAKLLENTYRHVNIALVNELAVFCRMMNLDVYEIIRAASSKPFGFQSFTPGAGVGGHCIPVDPKYASHAIQKLGYSFRFVELASDINSGMPSYVAERTTQILNEVGKPLKGSNILVVGVGYKSGTPDVRNSPAETVIGLLRRAKVDVVFFDQLIATFAVDNQPVTAADDLWDAVASADLVLLLAPHRDIDLDRVCEIGALVFDTTGTAPLVEGVHHL